MINTAIFDMDGLLIDSEPLWEEAALECFPKFGIKLSKEQYLTTVGLRTVELVEYWFRKYDIDFKNVSETEKYIFDTVCQKVATKGKLMHGAIEILQFFKQRNFKLAIGSSSASKLIQQVIDTYHLDQYLDTFSSAEFLEFGKPHPQVYIDCMKKLGSLPQESIVFEDSFNGMIAAKAAKIKCVVVPAADQYKQERWGAADAKISSLKNFNGLVLDRLNAK